MKSPLLFQNQPAYQIADGENRVLVSPDHGARTVSTAIGLSLIALAPKLDMAMAKAYANIRKLRVVGSYFRTDVGQSLWPPGTI